MTVCGQFWTISAIVYAEVNCTAFSLCLLPSFFVKQNQEETISFPTLLCSVPYYWLVKTTDRSTELVCCALSSQCYSFGFFVHKIETHFSNLNFPPKKTFSWRRSCSVLYYWLVKTTDRSTELVCCALSSQCYSFGFFVHKIETHISNLNFRIDRGTEALVTVLIFWFSIYRIITR